MLRRLGWAGLAVAVLAAGSVAMAKVAAMGVALPAAEVKWSATAIPLVSTAVVQGDMAKGPSHFYLKYAKGLVTPVHHHSADHYVTTISGTLLLTVDGVERRLTPGSYFAFTGKAAHSARVEGDEDVVMFVDAKGAWDVVPEKQAEKP